MSVGSLGPDDAVTVSVDSNVGAVVEQFAAENVGAVIVTEGDEPVGIVTDRDVALAVTEADDIASLPVEEVMTTDPATLHEDDDPMAISRAIDDQNVRRFPVVNDDGRVAGIVTLDDLVATIGEQLDNVADTIEAQSPDYRP